MACKVEEKKIPEISSHFTAYPSLLSLPDFEILSHIQLTRDTLNFGKEGSPVALGA